jgi:hypothetical protein
LYELFLFLTFLVIPCTVLFLFLWVFVRHYYSSLRRALRPYWIHCLAIVYWGTSTDLGLLPCLVPNAT